MLHFMNHELNFLARKPQRKFVGLVYTTKITHK